MTVAMIALDRCAIRRQRHTLQLMWEEDPTKVRMPDMWLRLSTQGSYVHGFLHPAGARDLNDDRMPHLSIALQGYA